MATRIVAGGALVSAARLVAILEPPRRDAPVPAEEDAEVGPPLGWLVAAAALAAIMDTERLLASAAGIAGDVAHAIVGGARLTPLGRLLDAAAGRVTTLGERGQAEADAGMGQAEEAWDALVDRIVHQAVRHVDVNELAASVDVDRIVEHLDLDAITERIDLDAIVHRLDLARIAREVLDDIAVDEIIRESSGSLVVETVDALRARGADADRYVARFVDRVLQRQRGRDLAVHVDGEGNGSVTADRATNAEGLGPA